MVLEVRNYENPDAMDFDAIWLNGAVDIVAGAWRGRFELSYDTDAFGRFHQELRGLERTLKGSVRFSCIEEQLEFTLTGDGRGHVAVNGEAIDRHERRTRLQFDFDIDQTQLRPLLAEVGALIERFPPRGR